MNSFQLGLIAIILLNVVPFGEFDSINDESENILHHKSFLLCALANNNNIINNKLVISCSDLRDETKKADDDDNADDDDGESNDSNEIRIETRSNKPYSPYYYEKFHQRPGGTKNQRKLKFLNKKYPKKL